VRSFGSRPARPYHRKQKSCGPPHFAKTPAHGWRRQQGAQAHATLRGTDREHTSHVAGKEGSAPSLSAPTAGHVRSGLIMPPAKRWAGHRRIVSRRCARRVRAVVPSACFSKRQLSANVLKELHEKCEVCIKIISVDTCSFQTFQVDWVVIAYKQNAYVLQSNP
jgi:hypothetical protein